MRKAFVVCVIGLGVAAAMTVIGIYAQTKPTEARLVRAAQVDNQNPIPGLDCARTGFVVVKPGDMAACPADRPFLNGIMYGNQTQVGVSGGTPNQIEWSFYCCKVTATKK